MWKYCSHSQCLCHFVEKQSDHSPAHLKWFENNTGDNSRWVDGSLHTTMLDWHCFDWLHIKTIWFECIFPWHRMENSFSHHFHLWDHSIFDFKHFKSFSLNYLSLFNSMFDAISEWTQSVKGHKLQSLKACTMHPIESLACFNSWHCSICAPHLMTCPFTFCLAFCQCHQK